MKVPCVIQARQAIDKYMLANYSLLSQAYHPQVAEGIKLILVDRVNKKSSLVVIQLFAKVFGGIYEK
ncbi:hypothetical protein [Serratia fonticola]|uniref:hypothetical protein n=1 Tax=Serratia fonticola TaxID=47917 RepID=UPI001C48D057|nr:hypothetical protein [Serratia fonticola]QXN62039.1 hypothetical protein J8M99_22445 [Serratia fonticola]